METQNISTATFANICYRKAGSGPVIILLHGFPEDGSLWDQIIPALIASFTVIIPDIPGSGRSIPAGEADDMEKLAEGICEILHHEQIDTAVIAGHSMGGYVALALAERQQTLVKGLSLVHSTAKADKDEKKETRRKSIELIRKGGKEPFVNGMIPNLFAPAFRESHPHVVQRQTERGMELKAEHMIGFYKAMINRPDRTNILSNAGFPVQWIIGKEDNVIPPDAVLPQSNIANVNFVSLYDNCGHMSMLEQPERLANDLSAFVVYCYNC